MEINHEAPVHAAVEMDIAAPLELVWEIQSDLARWPNWNPDVRSVELHGPVSPGTVFKWKAGGMSIVSQLEVVDPPWRLGWTGRTPGLRAVHVWQFSESERGTHVRTEESFEGAVARLLRVPLRGTLRATLERSLRALKEESERRAAHRHFL